MFCLANLIVPLCLYDTTVVMLVTPQTHPGHEYHPPQHVCMVFVCCVHTHEEMEGFVPERSPVLLLQMPGNVVFLFIASHNHAREGNDGLKRSILPVSPLKTTNVYHRVCSRHFPDTDASRDPQLNFGRHSASPKKIKNQDDRNLKS